MKGFQIFTWFRLCKVYFVFLGNKRVRIISFPWPFNNSTCMFWMGYMERHTAGRHPLCGSSYTLTRQGTNNINIVFAGYQYFHTQASFCFLKLSKVTGCQSKLTVGRRYFNCTVITPNMNITAMCPPHIDIQVCTHNLP